MTSSQGNSNDLDDGLKITHGRGMASLTDTYKLPADKRERDRLSLQHRLWRLMHGGTGLYPTAVDDIINRLLAPSWDNQQRTPAVLDVGSGSGDWATEMAELFPHVHVVGIDLAESKPDHIPPNCSFTARDVMNGLGDYAGQFDVVHCRSVRGHVGDVKKFLRELGEPLRTGGLVLLGDGLFGMFDENHNELKPHLVSSYTEPSPLSKADKSHSWLARWQYETIIRMGIRALPDTQNHGALTQNLRATGMFEESSMQENVYYCPVTRSGRGEERGEIMKNNTMEWLQSTQVVLLDSGIPRQVLDSWAENAAAEVLDPDKKMYMNWAMAWGIRKTD